MDSRIAHLKVAVGSYSCIPVVGHASTDITLFRNNHIGNRIVTFYKVLLRSEVDVHAELEINVPAVGHEILRFETKDIGQAVIVQTVNVQIAIHVTLLYITVGIGKTHKTTSIAVRREQIACVLVVEVVTSTHEHRNLPLTFLGSKHHTIATLAADGLRQDRRRHHSQQYDCAKFLYH